MAGGRLRSGDAGPEAPVGQSCASASVAVSVCAATRSRANSSALVCDGAKDQPNAASISAELRKRRPSSSRVRPRTTDDRLRADVGPGVRRSGRRRRRRRLSYGCRSAARTHGWAARRRPPPQGRAGRPRRSGPARPAQAYPRTGWGCFCAPRPSAGFRSTARPAAPPLRPLGRSARGTCGPAGPGPCSPASRPPRMPPRSAGTLLRDVHTALRRRHRLETWAPIKINSLISN